jgi:hypothetical protein
MTKLEHIEQAVSTLTHEELVRFRAWFDELEERRFDEALERDASGKLDKMAAEARANMKAGVGEEF